MINLIRLLRFVLQHPLNRKRRFSAVLRVAAWQLGSRLSPGAIAVPFVDSIRLLVKRGMAGATGNVYCGLHEFEDMAFVLHTLRPNDLFIDVGANVGSYTILAAGGAGANCVAIEPDPGTFGHLTDNVRLNNLEPIVKALNIGLGAKEGTLRFTAGLDTVNHVATTTEVIGETQEVPVRPLDAVLDGSMATLIKIDVEGFETEVLNGAGNTMQQSSVLGVVIELNGSGDRYGYDEAEIHKRMLGWGFLPARYSPFERSLSLLDDRGFASGNTLYVRQLEILRERLRTAPSYSVHGTRL